MFYYKMGMTMLLSEDQVKNYIQTIGYSALEQYEKNADNPEFGKASDWTIQFKDDSKIGWCDMDKKIININIAHEIHADKFHIFDTTMHEVAHALAGVHYSESGRRMVHGKEWNKWAKILGAAPSSRAISGATKIDFIHSNYDRVKITTSICGKSIMKMSLIEKGDTPFVGKSDYIIESRIYKNVSSVPDSFLIGIGLQGI